ncbi:MAG: hypothetical protein IJF48_01950 [Clostridia bacterium]|nr:hypothetical protein [Clostridia bacterium]
MIKKLCLGMFIVLCISLLASCTDSSDGNTDTTADDGITEVFNDTSVPDTENYVPDDTTAQENTLTLPTKEDWDALGLVNGVWYNIYDAVDALLSGDIDEFERLCGVAPGVYESLRGMVITEYSLTSEEIVYTRNGDKRIFPILEIEVEKSNSDYFTPGIHTLAFDEGLFLMFAKRDEFYLPSEYPFAESYMVNLVSDRDFYPILGENRSQFGLCDFIVSRLNKLAGDYEPRTEEEIRSYAEKYLGVDGDTLNIEQTLEKVDGGYQTIGRGGGAFMFTVLSEKVIDGINVVTVRYWADYSKTVPSRTVEFHMELLDGEYRPIKSVILEDSDFDTVFPST